MFGKVLIVVASALAPFLKSVAKSMSKRPDYVSHVSDFASAIAGDDEEALKMAYLDASRRLRLEASERLRGG